ncbi:hypothetical protein acsn021_14840 [Anaerocolumna cellulosilytica]|uniref:Aminoglycoside phosphotransferase domain-containing protein n=1 Tax=Anaerocolumna cellulosilytica TaxID=433286 RepID=A0A6S6R310_9FIRM|nr:phosphotransferase [Anaerocolumna cellulosilytica]MBB5196652.1 Ser/Thr protein kinase RdoA (MazF antagonist) [Anaerocolumna cellulosilytica]BCJ93915.1 hypothetical protein acsn021_14840 [Anaerocolumna cellulosilytica]
MLEQILLHWGMQGEVSKIHSRVWNISDQYVVKIYDKLEELERNLTILKMLHNEGIPVAEVIPLKDGKEYLAEEGKYYVMNRKLPGGSIKDLKKNPIEISYLMGSTISRLHLALLKCEEKLSFWDNSLLEEMNGWIYDKLKEGGWKDISKEEYENTKEELCRIYSQLPTQLIHRDVHFGNFLFEEGVFSGYIDFDLSQKNIRIFDIAYYLLGVLCEECRQDVREEQWLAIISETIRGYEVNISLSQIEKQHITTVMKSIEILFAVYFAGTKDESLAKDALELYHLVRQQEKKITRTIMNSY